MKRAFICTALLTHNSQIDFKPLDHTVEVHYNLRVYLRRNIDLNNALLTIQKSHNSRNICLVHLFAGYDRSIIITQLEFFAVFLGTRQLSFIFQIKRLHLNILFCIEHRIDIAGNWIKLNQYILIAQRLLNGSNR